MDLIDRQAARKALRKCQTYLFDAQDPELKIELRSAELAIKELPSAQPEITYCMECANRPECPWTRTEKDYCSRAQKRRNNE